jgi:hypothetical protein
MKRNWITSDHRFRHRAKKIKVDSALIVEPELESLYYPSACPANHFGSI